MTDKSNVYDLINKKIKDLSMSSLNNPTDTELVIKINTLEELKKELYESEQSSGGLSYDKFWSRKIKKLRESIMMDENDVKKTIAHMYCAMSRVCEKQCNAIESDLESYIIRDLKNGFEASIKDGRKFQLILELKEIVEDDEDD